MSKFPIIKKVWGSEEILVNEPEYCCKMLKLNKGASGSLHYHPIKKESFMILKGKIILEYDGKKCTVNEDFLAITIDPGVHHRFTGLVDSVILEASTHHDDDDVVRLEKSKA